MALELETVQWDRVDCVFEESDGNGVPHYNYRIQSRETLGSSNLEVFVEEETTELDEAGQQQQQEQVESSSRKTSGAESPSANVVSFRTGSSSSLGLKFNSMPGK